MARALPDQTSCERLKTHTFSSAAKHETTCTRCGGLMVNDSYIVLTK